jgi:hypothetical protein
MAGAARKVVTGNAVGQGYCNPGMQGAGARSSTLGVASMAKVRIADTLHRHDLGLRNLKAAGVTEFPSTPPSPAPPRRYSGRIADLQDKRGFLPRFPGRPR